MENRRDHCQACSNIKFGIKTRRSIPHTCDLKDNDILNRIEALRKRAETMSQEELIDVNNKIGEAIKLTDDFLKKYGIKEDSETGNGIGEKDHQ